MIRKVFVILVVVLLTFGIALAKEKKKNLKQQAQAPAAQVIKASPSITTPEAKADLVANITDMRNQELRVAVLGQLLNEEIAKLRNVQTTFCNKYKLDIEKFRQGLYRYDEQQAKFVETPPVPAPAAGAPDRPQQ